MALKRKALVVNPIPPSGYRQVRFGQMVPYSLPVLAGMLMEAGWEARILDMNFEPLIWEDESVVFITGQTAQAESMKSMAKKAKAAGKMVVMGGIHASMCPEDLEKWSDVIFRGELEGRVGGLMEEIERGRQKKVYDYFGQPPDLKGTPIPAHDKVPRYPGVFIRTLQTTRGCPYNCDICSVTAFNGHRLRHRPLGDIERELKLLKRLKTKILFLVDDDAFEDKAYSKELINLLGRFNFRIIAQCRVTLATQKEKLLAEAAQAGFFLAFVGLERVSDGDLKEMGKGTSVIENRKAIEKFHKFGVAVMGGMIFGYPSDDLETAREMADFYVREKIDLPQVSLLTPFPGTRLREKMLRKRRVLPGGWEKYDAITPLIKIRGVSPDRQAKLQWLIYREAYSLVNILKRLLPTLLKLGLINWVVVFLFNLEMKRGSRIEAKLRKII